MKIALHWTFLILSLLMICSCDKVINLELKDNLSQYVIEGRITNERGPWKVWLSQTQNFKDVSQFRGVSGATVTITNKNVTTKLKEITTGIYETGALTGVPGQIYNLTVTVNGKVFTASSKMPQPAPYLNLYLKAGDFNPKNTILTVVYKDPEATTDYYWFEDYVNDTKLNGYDVFNDEFSVGQEVSQHFTINNKTNNPAYDLKKGDRLRVDMHCIDLPVYSYLFSLYNANGETNYGIAPANPVSNITGGALGFFSAYTQHSKTIIIP